MAGEKLRQEKKRRVALQEEHERVHRVSKQVGELADGLRLILGQVLGHQVDARSSYPIPPSSNIATVVLEKELAQEQVTTLKKCFQGADGAHQALLHEMDKSAHLSRQVQTREAQLQDLYKRNQWQQAQIFHLTRCELSASPTSQDTEVKSEDQAGEGITKDS